MKKLCYLLVMAIIAITGFVSCEDAVVSTPLTVDTTLSGAKATISGYVTAEMNLQTYGNEVVPEGTKLLVEVFYSDLNPAATNGKWADTVSVAADGTYSIVVPADANGVSVIMTPFPFQASQVQQSGEQNAEITKAYSSASVSVSIKSGEMKTQDFVYSDADLPLSNNMVNVSGKFTANLTDQTTGEENVPDGTYITFQSSTWQDSVAVTNGTYSIDVPSGVAVTWTADFKYTKSVWNYSGETDPAKKAYENVLFEYKISGSGIFGSVTKDYDLNAGEGIDLTETPDMVTLSGIVSAELNDTQQGLEALPVGTTIYFESGNWGGSANIGANGLYEIKVPAQKTISLSIKAALDVTANGSTTTKVFTYFNQSSVYSGSDDVTLNLTAYY
ncbi:MAG: hypothetical protein PHH37_04485 [Paludibacter sp.]|nr:hypothetical protein [Paludibacter sp.]